MQTTVWGPVGWSFLHCVAHGFPESPSDFDVENGLPIGTTAAGYRSFFINLGHVLPCKYCRESYLRYVQESPPATESRGALTRWLWEIHNRVNAKLGAVYDGADLETVNRKYESFRAKCSEKNSLGCTTPEARHTKKRSLVHVVSDATSVRRKMLVIVLATLAVVVTCVALEFTRKPTRRRL